MCIKFFYEVFRWSTFVVEMLPPDFAGMFLHMQLRSPSVSRLNCPRGTREHDWCRYLCTVLYFFIIILYFIPKIFFNLQYILNYTISKFDKQEFLA